MVKWVFLDIGDVLFDEDVPHQWLFHSILLTLRAHGKNVLWDDWNRTRRELTARGPNPEAAIKESLAVYCANVSETEIVWDMARAAYNKMRAVRPYGFLLDGITPVLEDLRADFRLGIVANQHPPVAEAVAEYGLTPLFDVIVISETVNLFKPDPAIFEYALAEAGITAPEALFIGDRADNDIRPAKALGMKTVRLRRGNQYALYNPAGAEFQADATVESVADLAAAVRRVSESQE